MAHSYLTQFPIENVSLNIIPCFCVPLLVVEFLLFVLLNRVGRANEVCSRSVSFNDSKAKKSRELELFNQLPSSSEKKEEDGHVWREDVEMVMENLGIFCHPGDVKIQERLGSNEVSNLFEEKEPSLEEVKGAFDVFDENRDGFIDAKELQRVLSVLGFKEGQEMENCRRMISVFDQNGDGSIDYSEFVKFMENIFC